MAWSDRPDLTARLGLVLVALSSAIYLLALDRLPMVIGGDEVHFAIHAESLARSGRDLNGERLPAFIRITDPLVPNHSSQIWYQPFLFYAMTPFIAVFGVNEWAARLPVALIAIANLWLFHAIARRLFTPRLAILATLAFAMTPAHIIVTRQALDYVAPLPFVLGWLLCLLRFLDTGSTRVLAAGTLLLGAGLFSYVAAWLLVPMLFIVTLVAIRMTGAPHPRAIWIAAAALAVPAAALALALLSTPGALAQTLARYSVSGAPAARPDLFERLTLYWNYFNPSFLFFAGGSNPTQATGRAGVFLLALAPLMIAGLRDIYLTRSRRGGLLVATMLLAPLPIAITMPPAANYSIGRAMTMVPFGVLIAAYGVQSLGRIPQLRLPLALLLAAVPLQFALFMADYRGDYQHRAAPRLDPVHMRGVADEVIRSEAASPAPGIYFSHRLDDGGARWRFFTLKYARPDLWEKSQQINLTEGHATLTPGSLVICYADDAAAAGLLASGYRTVATVAGIAGEAAALVLKAPG